jgi:hypothetical protein
MIFGCVFQSNSAPMYEFLNSWSHMLKIFTCIYLSLTIMFFFSWFWRGEMLLIHNTCLKLCIHLIFILFFFSCILHLFIWVGCHWRFLYDNMLKLIMDCIKEIWLDFLPYDLYLILFYFENVKSKVMEFTTTI